MTIVTRMGAALAGLLALLAAMLGVATSASAAPVANNDPGENTSLQVILNWTMMPQPPSGYKVSGSQPGETAQLAHIQSQAHPDGDPGDANLPARAKPYDRIAIRFSDAFPQSYYVQQVPVSNDPQTGRPLVPGSYMLRVVFDNASAHTPDGDTTVSGARGTADGKAIKGWFIDTDAGGTLAVDVGIQAPKVDPSRAVRIIEAGYANNNFYSVVIDVDASS